MPEIQAFRGIRYDLGHVGSLSDVVAPPYDVIAPQLQDQLYKRHPCNAVRLILNRMEPGDDEANNRYIRAKQFLKRWQSEGVLFTEADPAIYVYQQEFTLEGKTYTRGGFMARMRIEPFGGGRVFPHEQTMAKPKIDRLMLTAVCQANLSQIFCLYPDPESEGARLLERAVAGATPTVAEDHLGTIHRMWPVTDLGLISQLSAVIGPKPAFVADGHHRYETACTYRDQVFQSGSLSPEHPANFVLTHLVAMEDPGLAILPTHRLFRGLPDLTGDELVSKLGQYFATRPAGQGPQDAQAVWEDIQTGSNSGAIALFTQADQRWTIAQLTNDGGEKMAQVARDHNDQWRLLGVSILHQLIIQTLLKQADCPTPDYVHLMDDVVNGLGAGQFPLAALVTPPSVKDIQAVSLQGDRMPAKSTYFYPKLLCGLVINPLE